MSPRRRAYLPHAPRAPWGWNFWQLRNNLGNIHLTRGEYDRAIASYERALEIRPRSHVALSNYAIGLMLVGRLEEALEAVGRSLLINPRFGGALFCRGAIHEARGNRHKAHRDWKRGAAMDPRWRAHQNDYPWFDRLQAFLEQSEE